MAEKVKNQLLIIDDEEDVCEILEILLGDVFDVSTLTDSRQAYTEIDSGKYDVVLTDVNMPEVSGIDIIKYVSKSKPDLPVIAFSGHVEFAPNQMLIIKELASDFVEKPFNSSSNLQKIIFKALED